MIKSYDFNGADGVLKMQDVMKMFRFGFKTMGGLEVEQILDHGSMEYRLAGGSSVTISPCDAEAKIEIRISITGDDRENTAGMEERVRRDLESIIYMDHGMGYCCE